MYCVYVYRKTVDVIVIIVRYFFVQTFNNCDAGQKISQNKTCRYKQFIINTFN